MLVIGVARSLRLLRLFKVNMMLDTAAGQIGLILQLVIKKRLVLFEPLTAKLVFALLILELLRAFACRHMELMGSLESILEYLVLPP